MKKSKTINIRRNLFLLFLGSSFLLSCNSQEAKDSGSFAVPVIFDTDLGPDYDDVGAITILHQLAEEKQTEILATIGCNRFDKIVPLLSLFNDFWGASDIPIGVVKGDGVDLSDRQHWSDSLLKKYPHALKSNEEAEEAVALYRKTLSQQPDTSVTIISVGFLTNLSNLLQSPADEYSELNGTELVDQKVKKLVSMAGGFPEGREFNVFNDTKASQNVAENWPTEILFSGFEIGTTIKTGLPLVQNKEVQSPAKDAYRIAMSKAAGDSLGRSSWDLTAVLVAVKGIEPWFDMQSGKITVEEDGSNAWNEEEEGHHYLILKDGQKEALTDTLNTLMQAVPKDKNWTEENPPI